MSTAAPPRAGADAWLQRTLDRAMEFWFRPVDPVRLDTFERVFALTFLIYMAAWFTHATEWLTAWGFHVSVASSPVSQPAPYPLLPAWAVPFFGVAMFGSTLAFILRWRKRAMIWIMLACAAYVWRVDRETAFTLNKFYVLFFSLLAVAPAPRLVSLREGEEPVLRQSAWPVRVIQATLIIQYFTAGHAKMFHGDWLKSTDVLWTQVQGLYCTDLCAWMLRILPKEAWVFMMYFALAFELFAPILFLFRRTRIVAYIWGFGFQMMIATTMYMLIYFSQQMLSFYIVFMSAEFLHRARSLLHVRAPGWSPPSTA
jgi:hypothetical protein